MDKSTQPSSSDLNQAPKAPRKKMSKRQKIIFIGVGSLIAVIILLVLFVVSTLNTPAGEPGKVTVEPPQKSAYLDNRYSDGFTPFDVKGENGRFAGASTDGKIFATWSQLSTDQLRSQSSRYLFSGELSVNGRTNNELQLYNTDSQKLKKTTLVEQCSDITSEDTILCSTYQEKDGNEKGRHIIQTIDINTGKTTLLTEASLKPLTKLQYLGINNGATLLYVEQQDEGLSATDAALVSIGSDGKVRYGLNLETSLTDCALAKDSKTFICTSKVADNPEGSHKTFTINVEDGKKIAEAFSANPPVITTDGWIVETTDYSKGISIGGPASTSYVYDVQGKKTEVTNVPTDFIPAPKVSAGSTIQYKAKDMLSQPPYESYVVSSEGKILARKNLNASGIGGPYEYVRVNDGKKLFVGSPINLTRDNKYILAADKEVYDSETYTIYEVANGNKVAQIKAQDRYSPLESSHGFLYQSKAGKTTIYLPGK